MPSYPPHNETFVIAATRGSARNVMKLTVTNPLSTVAVNFAISLMLQPNPSCWLAVVINYV